MTTLQRFEVVWSDYTTTLLHARDYVDARDLAESQAQRSNVTVIRITKIV